MSIVPLYHLAILAMVVCVGLRVGRGGSITDSVLLLITLLVILSVQTRGEG